MVEPTRKTTISIRDAAHRIGVSSRKLRGWILEGCLPWVRIGKRKEIRLFPADVARMVASSPFAESGGLSPAAGFFDVAAKWTYPSPVAHRKEGVSR